jgi:hypothetical protein
LQETCELRAEYQAWDKEMLRNKARKEKKWEMTKGKRQGSLIAKGEVGYRSQFCTPTYLASYFFQE